MACVRACVQVRLRAEKIKRRQSVHQHRIDTAGGEGGSRSRSWGQKRYLPFAVVSCDNRFAVCNFPKSLVNPHHARAPSLFLIKFIVFSFLSIIHFIMRQKEGDNNGNCNWRRPLIINYKLFFCSLHSTLGICVRITFYSVVVVVVVIIIVILVVVVVVVLL